MMDHRSHSQAKRIVSSVYTKSYLQNSGDWQTMAGTVVFERLLPIMNEIARKGTAVDVFELAKSAAMDLSSGYIFGSVHGMNFLQDVEYRRKWLHAFESFLVQSPEVRAGGMIEQSCMAMCKAAEAASPCTENNEAGSVDTRAVVFEQLSERIEVSDKEAIPKSRMNIIASELLDHLIAGHESSGITLTYAMYELSVRPQMQDQLRQELSSLSLSLSQSSTSPSISNDKTRHDLPSPSAIDRLPFLDAILQETLRLWHAVPGPQPRVVPATPTPVNISGYDIPVGVRISSSAYTLHRNADVFPDPDVWNPDRWIKANKERRQEMNRWMWAFSSGGRMCLGNHLAVQSTLSLVLSTFGRLSWKLGFMPLILIARKNLANDLIISFADLKTILAAIYSNFTTSVIDASGIEQEGTFVAGPVSKRLMLGFKHVNAAE
ncbi:MAG: hypothetical protein Q9174_003370 [Haloplaca sp. 1 TL-2023]